MVGYRNNVAMVKCVIIMRIGIARRDTMHYISRVACFKISLCNCVTNSFLEVNFLYRLTRHMHLYRLLE